MACSEVPAEKFLFPDPPIAAGGMRVAPLSKSRRYTVRDPPGGHSAGSTTIP